MTNARKTIWRVQFLSRRATTADEQEQGSHDFDREDAARAFHASDGVQGILDRFWRAEVRKVTEITVVEVVASTPYGEE